MIWSQIILNYFKTFLKMGQISNLFHENDHRINRNIHPWYYTVITFYHYFLYQTGGNRKTFLPHFGAFGGFWLQQKWWGTFSDFLAIFPSWLYHVKVL